MLRGQNATARNSPMCGAKDRISRSRLRDDNFLRACDGKRQSPRLTLQMGGQDVGPVRRHRS
jgi:hypothetical protein